jgi:mannose-6-phosphate isomerase-like protein (cupin superfamily)
MKILWVLILTALCLPAKDPLDKRIGHSDPAKARPGTDVHNGAGVLGIQMLLGADAVTGLNFMHHGPLMPKSSIGQHFHNNSEEMFLILDADVEFTIDGHTAIIPGPVGVPCRAGHSHAVYNPTNHPVDWVNFNVQVGNPPVRGGRGNWFAADPTATFNLGDDRVGAPLEPHATFLNTGRLTRDTMRPMTNMDGGKGTVLYRRGLGPSIFTSNWAFVDHIVLPPGTSIGKHMHQGVEEVYFVMHGEGKVQVDEETAPLHKGDAVPVRVKEVHSFENTGNTDLELLVYGIAIEKGKLDITDIP